MKYVSGNEYCEKNVAVLIVLRIIIFLINRLYKLLYLLNELLWIMNYELWITEWIINYMS